MTDTGMTETANASNRSQIDGALLIGTSLLIMFSMMHHPQVATHDANGVLGEIAAKAWIDRLVHGTLMILIGIQAVAYAGIYNRLGSGKIMMQAAAIAFGAGVFMLLQAALVDGFVVPQIATAYLPGAADEGLAARHLLNLCSIFIRAATGAGLCAMAIAFALGSVECLMMRPRLKMLGFAGLLLSALPLAAIMSGSVSLDLRGAILLMASQTVWNFVVATMALQRKI